VEELLASDLPASVRELVVERAEGNPFFVEEVLGSLIDAGVLRRENGGWRATELPLGFEIPDSVQAVLALRARGVVDEDEALLDRADELFRGLGIDWYVGQTESLRRLRRRAVG
jgi:hypothetical protein